MQALLALPSAVNALTPPWPSPPPDHQKPSALDRRPRPDLHVSAVQARQLPSPPLSTPPPFPLPFDSPSSLLPSHPPSSLPPLLPHPSFPPFLPPPSSPPFIPSSQPPPSSPHFPPPPLPCIYPSLFSRPHSFSPPPSPFLPPSYCPSSRPPLACYGRVGCSQPAFTGVSSTSIAPMFCTETSSPTTSSSTESAISLSATLGSPE